eukprot:1194798-Amphidinium_carterae.1
MDTQLCPYDHCGAGKRRQRMGCGSSRSSHHWMLVATQQVSGSVHESAERMQGHLHDRHQSTPRLSSPSALLLEHAKYRGVLSSIKVPVAHMSFRIQSDDWTQQCMQKQKLAQQRPVSHTPYFESMSLHAQVCTRARTHTHTHTRSHRQTHTHTFLGHTFCDARLVASADFGIASKMTCQVGLGVSRLQHSC